VEAAGKWACPVLTRTWCLGCPHTPQTTHRAARHGAWRGRVVAEVGGSQKMGLYGVDQRLGAGENDLFARSEQGSRQDWEADQT
jgi:hypothetical protein